jgi:hypothetical protein
VYLTHNGEPVAAIIPADVPSAGAAAIEARENAEDIRKRTHGTGRSWSGYSTRGRADRVRRCDCPRLTLDVLTSDRLSTSR